MVGLFKIIALPEVAVQSELTYGSGIVGLFIIKDKSEGSFVNQLDYTGVLISGLFKIAPLPVVAFQSGYGIAETLLSTYFSVAYPATISLVGKNFLSMRYILSTNLKTTVFEAVGLVGNTIAPFKLN
jgi:hypothetical protein